jgi:rfaE bifunctional protein kinase chain/domain
MDKFIKNYQHKIKSNTLELLKLIRKFPRKETIIMCHGVFDVVHPGHIRHLIYAKTKADKLLVTLTADKHIKKGTYRPHVPQDLRAINIAALEMVDFVLIDNNATPNQNMKRIKPDFFSKGFEYSSSSLPRATKEESSIVKSYGGQMIFSPGDIVFSSSKFLSMHLPKIENEKLILLMNKNKITFSHLRKIVNDLNKIKVHVVGDTIIDTYTKTNLIGGQTKTPTISVLYQNQKEYIGGAGIVAQHLNAAGAKVTFTSVLGNDNYKDFVKDELKKLKIKFLPIIDNTRPTTNKNVFTVEDYKILKVDTLDNQPISQIVLSKLLKQIKNIKSDIIILSDFRHGIFNKNSISSIIKSCGNSIFKAADSQVATRWGNITDFKNFNLITPNEREARFSLADQDSSISELSRRLKEKANFKSLILKLGSRGIFCVNYNKRKNKKKGDNLDDAFSIPSFVNNVVDAVGTGDALLAYSTLTMFKTKSLVLSGIIGSIAAACECEVEGNIPIKTNDIQKKIDEIEKLLKYQTKF